MEIGAMYYRLFDCGSRSMRVQPSRFYRAGRAATRLTLKASPSLAVLTPETRRTPRIRTCPRPESPTVASPVSPPTHAPGDSQGPGEGIQAQPESGGSGSSSSETTRQPGRGK